MQTAPITISTFFNVRPITTIQEGLRLGDYTDNHPNMTDEKLILLRSVEGEKTIHLVCFNQRMPIRSCVEIIRGERKRLCHNAPHYLLGLMAMVKEWQMPGELSRRNVVAAELDNLSSLFFDGFGIESFLCVHRRFSPRKLRLVHARKDWPEHSALLAEDL